MKHMQISVETRVLGLKGTLENVYSFGPITLLSGAGMKSSTIAIKWSIIKFNTDRIAFLLIR